MQPAPLQQIQPAQANSSIVFVDRDAAAGLLLDFLAALEKDDPAQRDACIKLAGLRAERQLAAWGVAR